MASEKVTLQLALFAGAIAALPAHEVLFAVNRVLVPNEEVLEGAGVVALIALVRSELGVLVVCVVSHLGGTIGTELASWTLATWIFSEKGFTEAKSH